MPVVPFRWLGTTRMEKLRSLLASRAENWLQEWAAPAAQLNSTVVATYDAEPLDRCYALRGRSGTVIVEAGQAVFEWLGCQLAGVRAADTQGVAVGIGRESLQDFCRSLVHSDDKFAELSETVVARGALGPKSGVARFLWSLGEQHIALCLDTSLCSALAPSPDVREGQLARRQEALLPSEISLRALLDLGQAALEYTIDLRPGDVIKTNVALDSQVTLQLGCSDGPVLRGALTAAEGHRAFRCSNSTCG
jgi:hypothetical protein